MENIEYRKMSMAENVRGPYLVWKDLTVVVRNASTTTKVLNETTGYAQPNRIMALMGPSGSGKTILLDALAGQLSANVKMTGHVLFKGRTGGNSKDCLGISYLTQEDAFLGTLTVRESISYSANLRLSAKKDKKEIDDAVERTIKEMGLEHCADTNIGNWHMRGISDGEKKRLSIGLEILTHPYVMFVDEPTSGLDSASAYFVVLALRNIALHGKIVVCSIHHPSYYLFDLFDDLYLLSGGEVVYFGDAKMAVKFFAESGFPCPVRRNPSDHFLRCVNSDFDNIASTLLRSQCLNEITAMSNSLMNFTTQDIKQILIDRYKTSEYSTIARNKIHDVMLTEENIKISNKSNAKWWKQLSTMIRRSFVNMTRDMGYYWLRILFYVAVSLSVGSIYFKIDTSFLAITARANCEAFIYGFMICLSVGGLPSFMEELKVYNKEILNKHYGEGLFLMSNFVSSLPFLVVITVSSGAVVYNMVKLHSGFSHLCYFFINLFCCISILESSMMVVATLVPNVLMGIGIGTALVVLVIMSSAILRPLPDLPKIFWRYPMSYISFASWALQGAYKNDMVGLEFDNLALEDTNIKGEIVLLKMFGTTLDHSKWWDLAALVCLLIFHRLLLLMVLKYKHRMSSLIGKLSAKTIFKLARSVPLRSSSSRSSRDHTTLSNIVQTKHSVQIL